VDFLKRTIDTPIYDKAVLRPSERACAYGLMDYPDHRVAERLVTYSQWQVE